MLTFCLAVLGVLVLALVLVESPLGKELGEASNRLEAELFKPAEPLTFLKQPWVVHKDPVFVKDNFKWSYWGIALADTVRRMSDEMVKEIDKDILIQVITEAMVKRVFKDLNEKYPKFVDTVT